MGQSVTHTTILAAQGIVGMSQEIYTELVAVCGFAALGVGILVGLRNGWKQGLGSAIGAVVGGVIFSLFIANASGLHDAGDQELKDRGMVSSVYGR